MEANKNMQNMQNNFSCDICHYICSKRHLFNQHILTAKHQKRVVELTKANKNMQNMQNVKILNFNCEKCNIEFKHQSSYCRHKKKCNLEKDTEVKLCVSDSSGFSLESDKDLIMMLVKQNSELL